MSAAEIINELPKLTEPERHAVLQKLHELTAQHRRADATNSRREDRQSETNGTVDLPARGITEVQAADLRSRLKTFAEDWERPEAAIYDEDPAR